jgi:hypothetical protein
MCSRRIDQSVPLATRTDNAMLTNTLSILFGITTAAILAAPPALHAAEANSVSMCKGRCDRTLSDNPE